VAGHAVDAEPGQDMSIREGGELPERVDSQPMQEIGQFGAPECVQ
jgi:hypothetical protein